MNTLENEHDHKNLKFSRLNFYSVREQFGVKDLHVKYELHYTDLHCVIFIKQFPDMHSFRKGRSCCRNDTRHK